MGCNNLAVALVHYPVYNKHHEVVTSALTNLDQHDIARSSKTFGLDRFYIVTPSEEQRKLAERISGHWQQGWGADYNPDRRQALEIVRVTPTVASAVVAAVVPRKVSPRHLGSERRPAKPMRARPAAAALNSHGTRLAHGA